VDAVVFDCDGVLVDSETIAGEVELEAFQRLGLFVDEVAFKAQVQGLSVEGWSRVLNALHVEQRGVPLPEGFAGEMSREITRRILADVRPIPGAVDAVHVVRGPKAIASSSPKVELYGKISALGLWNTFGGHVYSGDDVRSGKPAPDLFLLAAGRLGILPGRCLVIEDSLNGVRAGLSAGMTVWGFAGGPHCRPGHARDLIEAGADEVFSDMRRVASALLALG
jgi:HAD superfamily hydrolase (TIGR01509 family)